MHYLKHSKVDVVQSPEAQLQAWHAPCIHRHGKEGKEREQSEVKKKKENTTLGGISAWDAQSDFREIIN